MTPAVPIHTDIILIGGGHAHVEVIRKFGMEPESGVRLTLVSTPVDTFYSGMLPGYLAGHYDFDDYTVDLQKLCRFANCRLIVDRATGIDSSARRVILADRPLLAYDWLSIDIGSVPDKAGIEGTEHAIPVKPVPEFLERWTDVEVLARQRRGDIKIAVIGAGAGGVEAALALHYRLLKKLEQRGDLEKTPDFTIISRSKEAMPGHAAGVRRRMAAALARKNIALITGQVVTAITPEELVGNDGWRADHDAAILVTPGAAMPWLAETGLATDDRGFLRVGKTLQSMGNPRVFAAGDCATFDPTPLPKAGVYAVRQGPVLAENLRRLARGDPPVPFKPQRNILALISLGEKRAVASKEPFAAEGDWVWRWKDGIDRRWMNKYGEDLPDMAAMPATGGDTKEAMRCGGCGAKVPAAILNSVLDRLRDDPATSGALHLDEADDAAVVSIPGGAPLFQTVDQFRAFIDDPYLFGRIAANHCFGDIYAMGGRPASALVTVTLPFADPVIMERDLDLLLRGVLSASQEAGAVLIGGHTAEGAEMTVGLTVNGAVEGRPWRKGGAKPGEKLILTKPLGIGVLMAAEMQRAAKGRDVRAALEEMQVSNAAAADILRDHGATACTDITGFGLGGHLLEMLDASACSAIVETKALPVLAGAAALLEQGVASTLHPANRTALLQNTDAIPPEIIADPQTAGGLLATVTPKTAEACVRAMRTKGYEHASLIGEIAPGNMTAGMIFR